MERRGLFVVGGFVVCRSDAEGRDIGGNGLNRVVGHDDGGQQDELSRRTHAKIGKTFEGP